MSENVLPVLRVAVVCIGSNTPDADLNIRRALTALMRHGHTLAISDIYKVSEPYLNLVAALVTTLDPAALTASAKEIELRLGRDDLARAAGRVPVDIDVVVCDGAVLRPADFQAEYFRVGYRQILVSQRSEL